MRGGITKGDTPHDRLVNIKKAIRYSFFRNNDYFLLVEPLREAAFLDAIEKDGTMDFEEYGKIIASCYGEEPSEDIKSMLKAKYGFDV